MKSLRRNYRPAIAVALAAFYSALFIPTLGCGGRDEARVIRRTPEQIKAYEEEEAKIRARAASRPPIDPAGEV